MQKEAESRDTLGSLQIATFQKMQVPSTLKQTAAVTSVAVLLWFFVIFYVVSLLYAVFLSESYVPLALHTGYYAWTRLQATETQGGRPWPAFRHSEFWRYFREYFPIEVRLKSGEFPEKHGNFLFGYHPHGLSSVGAMGAFGPQHADVAKMLGGLEVAGCTLESNFRIPVVREFLLAMGAISVSERSIKTALNAGRAVMVVLGGANEALYAKPLTHDVVIRRRFGFFRIALETGSAVVPVYSFGENDVYDQVDTGFTRRVNGFFVKYFGFFIPLYFGGIQTPLNPVPKRRVIITVIGDPIEVERNPQPSAEEVERLKQKYIAGLVDIFDKFADLYSPRRINNLTIVE